MRSRSLGRKEERSRSKTKPGRGGFPPGAPLPALPEKGGGEVNVRSADPPEGAST